MLLNSPPDAAIRDTVTQTEESSPRRPPSDASVIVVLGSDIMAPIADWKPQRALFIPVVLLLFLSTPLVSGADLPEFRDTVITSNLNMGYQLVVADLNGDGKPDLIAVDERGTELAWYENPSWERHVIIK